MPPAAVTVATSAKTVEVAAVVTAAVAVAALVAAAVAVAAVVTAALAVAARLAVSLKLSVTRSHHHLLAHVDYLLLQRRRICSAEINKPT